MALLLFGAVAAAFPEFVDPASVAQGLRQEVRAVVSSPELRGVVGAEALTRFEMTPMRSPDVWFAEAKEVGLGVELEMAALRS